MELIDISRDLLKTPVYPGDPEGYVDNIKSNTKIAKINEIASNNDNFYKFKGIIYGKKCW